MSESQPSRGATNDRPSVARHGRLRRSNPWLFVLKIVGASMVVVLVSASVAAGFKLWKTDAAIKTVTLVGETEGPPPSLGAYEGGFNLLLVGSDRCEDPAGCKDRDAELNDVTILLHVSEDQSNAVAVSFPRDLVVPIPSCPTESGGNSGAMSAQPINVTLFYGGLPCTVLTVSKFTGVDIQFAALVTFSGVARISSAIGGVDVCVNGPVVDPYSGINLPAAGEYSLEGWEALAFLRTRHGVGDGSDLGRISNQQVFMSALVRTLKKDGVLNDFGTLYKIATVASENLTVSQGLKNINTMISMAQVLKDIPLDRVMFVQYPGATGQDGVYSGKVKPIKPIADQLFSKILSDEAFLLEAGNTGSGSVADPNAPAPTEESTTEGLSTIRGLKGQSAADYTCSNAN